MSDRDHPHDPDAVWHPHDPDAVWHTHSLFVHPGSSPMIHSGTNTFKWWENPFSFDVGKCVDNNVIPISGQPAGTNPVLSPEAQGIVDILRTALEIAEHGQLTSIFIAYADRDGSPGGVFDGEPGSVTYAVSRLMRRFHRQIDEREG